MNRLIALAGPALLSVAVLACGGSVDRSGLFAGDGGADGDGGAGSDGESGNCTATPRCDDGFLEVPDGRCPDDARCDVRTVCGVTITCAPGRAICTAIPSCREGHRQVQVCPKDVKCTQETECGVTILCYDPIQCAGAFACDPGDDQVKSENDCYEDGYCYSRDVCGTTIWCTGFRSPTRDAGGGA